MPFAIEILRKELAILESNIPMRNRPPRNARRRCNEVSAMTRSDPMKVDAEAVLATIHGLQVDLSLLAAWLARHPEPVMKSGSVLALAEMRQSLLRYSPAPQRH
jgi:hypothetical protein